MGGLDKLMERLRELLEEQKGRHEGGSKWIGTNGTSPFGNGGFNPEGIRVGGPSAGNRTAVKVWEQRAYRDYDDEVELGTRNIKVALRRLRRFAREGAEDELDLDGTIASTARNAGYLDIRLRPERHNTIKVLMLLDVGGTMDDHITRTEELFSAAKSEFKHLEFYYFHNCVYDFVWKNNRRRHAERLMTWDLLRKFNSDYRLILVGDATMSPYEVLQPGGSVEYNNEEAGRGVAAAPGGTLPQVRLAQSRARGRLGVPAVDLGDPAADGEPDVPGHAGRARARDARADALMAGTSLGRLGRDHQLHAQAGAQRQ